MILTYAGTQTNVHIPTQRHRRIHIIKSNHVKRERMVSQGTVMGCCILKQAMPLGGTVRFYENRLL